MFDLTALAVKDLLHSIKQLGLSFRADLQIWRNLTVPIRLAYARDEANYAVACDEEACFHYGEKPGKLWQLGLAARYYVKGLFTKEIPQTFIDHWFSESNTEPSSIETTRPCR